MQLIIQFIQVPLKPKVQYIFQVGPFNTFIIFNDVQLDCHTVISILPSQLEGMHHFMINQDIIRDEMIGSEGTLFGVNHGVHIGLKKGSKDLRDDFVYDIAQSNRLKIFHRFDMFNFWNQRNQCMVNLLLYGSSGKKVLDNITNLPTHYIPVLLKNKLVKPYSPRALVG